MTDRLSAYGPDFHWAEIDSDVMGGAQPDGLVALLDVTRDAQRIRLCIAATDEAAPVWIVVDHRAPLWDAVQAADELDEWRALAGSEYETEIRSYLAAKGF